MKIYYVSREASFLSWLVGWCDVSAETSWTGTFCCTPSKCVGVSDLRPSWLGAWELV